MEREIKGIWHEEVNILVKKVRKPFERMNGNNNIKGRCSVICRSSCTRIEPDALCFYGQLNLLISIYLLVMA